MKKLLLSVFFFLFSIIAFSQEYFILEGKKEILTKEQLQNKIVEFNNRIKSITKKNATHAASVSYKIIETKKKNDSIIHKVAYDYKYNSTKTEKIYTLEGKLLPEFKLRTVKGDKTTLEDLKGKVTFINLWFTNCFPCVKEIPLLNILQKKYKDNVNFVAITFDQKDKVKKFLKKKDFNFTHLINAGSYLRKNLGNKAYPKILILDSKGVINYIGDGIPTEYDYKKKKMKERDEKSLKYLEDIIDKLVKA